jgi:hypothetical protein
VVKVAGAVEVAWATMVLARAEEAAGIVADLGDWARRGTVLVKTTKAIVRRPVQNGANLNLNFILYSQLKLFFTDHERRKYH